MAEQYNNIFFVLAKILYCTPLPKKKMLVGIDWIKLKFHHFLPIF